MPRIPQVQTYIAPQTGPAQVLANPNMRDAEFQGMQQLASGIGQVANAASDYAQKLDNANYVAKSAEADRKVKTAWTKYQEQMLTNQAKPDEWAKGWDELYSKVSQDVDLKSLSPAARQRVQEQMKSFQSDSLNQISLQSTKQRIRNGQAEITTSAGLDLKNGDWQGYESKIKEGAKAGFFDPEAEMRLMEDGRKQFDFEQANKAINLDPFGALDAIESRSEKGEWNNFKALDENRRLALVREAKTAVSKERSDTIQSIVERQNGGEIISDAELDGMVQSRRLLATQVKWVQQQQKRAGNDPEMIVEYANLLTAIDKYQPSQDPTNEKFSALTAHQLKFPSELRSEIDRRLKEAKTNSAIKRKEGYEYVDNLLAGSFLGNIDRSQSGTGKPTDPADYLRAHQKAVDLRMQLDEFLRQNPGASGPEQLKFINQLTTKDRAKTGANLLDRSRSGTVKK